MSTSYDSEHRRLANARERKRMHSINHGFNMLRNRLPRRFHDKRLSKAETLKSAIEYINTLRQIINQTDNSDSVSTPPSSCEVSPSYPIYYAHQTYVWIPPTTTNKHL